VSLDVGPERHPRLVHDCLPNRHIALEAVQVDQECRSGQLIQRRCRYRVGEVGDHRWQPEVREGEAGRSLSGKELAENATSSTTGWHSRVDLTLRSTKLAGRPVLITGRIQLVIATPRP